MTRSRSSVPLVSRASQTGASKRENINQPVYRTRLRQEREPQGSTLAISLTRIPGTRGWLLSTPGFLAKPIEKKAGGRTRAGGWRQTKQTPAHQSSTGTQRADFNDDENAQEARDQGLHSMRKAQGEMRVGSAVGEMQEVRIPLPFVDACRILNVWDEGASDCARSARTKCPAPTAIRDSWTASPAERMCHHGVHEQAPHLTRNM